MGEPFRRRIYNVATFRAAMNDACEHMDEFRAAHRDGRVDRAFSERIMLAVTQVNACRYCNYAHSRVALRAGVSPEELAALATGDFRQAPPEQLVALLFAQHYAETRGHPDAEAWQHVVEAYGQDAARDVMAHIRMITMANLLGNTLDAFLSRLRLRPAANSSLGQELGVLLGAVVLAPVAMVRARVAQQS